VTAVKEVMYASTKDVLIVSIVCYILASHGNEAKVINFVTNSFKQITDLIQRTLQPRIERNVFQQPESFMTTVTITLIFFWPYWSKVQQVDLIPNLSHDSQKLLPFEATLWKFTML
jgi:hypothetical protein